MLSELTVERPGRQEWRLEGRGGEATEFRFDLQVKEEDFDNLT